MTTRNSTTRRVLSLSLLCVSLSAAVAVSAQPFLEFEESEALDRVNDSQAPGFDVPANNQLRSITGKINTEGDVDQWAFDVGSGVKAVQVFTDASRVVWAVDSNRNSQSDPDDVVFSLTRGQENPLFTMNRVRNGAKILAIVSGEPGERYRFLVSQKGKPTRDVIATFIDAEALDRFDGRFRGHRADFRAKVSFLKPTRDLRIPSVSKKISNNDKPTFDLKHRMSIGTSTRKVPIQLRLVDVDRAGKDDVADISPNFTGRSLDVEYDAILKLVRGPSGETLGKLGEVITIQGSDKGRRAKISFRIDTKEPIAVPRAARKNAIN